MEQTFVFATIGRRFVALLIDGIVLQAVMHVLVPILTKMGVSSDVTSELPIFVIVNAIYFTVSVGLTGKTIGKAILGIKVVKTNGDQPDPLTALIRYAVSFVGGIVFALGYVWAFTNPTRQTWHDLVAKTYVINK